MTRRNPVPNRRDFLGRALGAASIPALLPRADAAASPEPGPPRARPQVVAIYYPHWHSYDHGSSWKGEGWTEWEGVKVAPARFEGHAQPKHPLWGTFDESDPAWAAREIDLAADHGIDVFLNCWYWYSGVQNMQEALERGFLKAPNRDRMKFAIMWANHDRRDQFCPAFGERRTVWLPSRHSPRDLDRVIGYAIDHYFHQPNYWRVDGALFFSVFEAKRFVGELGGPKATRHLIGKIDARLSREGLPRIHWSGMTNDPKVAQLLAEAGFASTGRYNIQSAGKIRPDGTERYEDVMVAHREQWAKMAATPIVHLPVVTVGWDSTPRCRADVPFPFPRNEYPYGHVIVGNTPELYESLLRDARQHVANAPHHPPAILLNAWNEWTEGGYLLPEERTGTRYLEAIHRTFPR